MSTQRPLSQPRLIGLRSNKPPLRDLAIDLDSDLTVLYGRNGAGKSRILQALTSALTGYRDPDASEEPFHATHVIVELPPSNPGDGRATQVEWDELRAQIVGEVKKDYATHYDDSPAFSPGIMEELLRSPYRAFVPTGTDHSAWDAWICLSWDEGNPYFQGDMDTAIRLASAHDALLEVAFWDEATDSLHASVTPMRERLNEYWSLLSGANLDGRLEELDAQLNLILASEDRAFDPDLICEGAGQSANDPMAAQEDAVVGFLSFLSFAVVERASLGWLGTRFVNHEYLHHFVRLLLDGLPIPVARLPKAEFPLHPLLEDDAETVNFLTAQHLREQLDVTLSPEGPSYLSSPVSQSFDLAFPPTVLNWLETQGHEATVLYATLLQDAPGLKVSLTPPPQWLTESAIQWGTAAPREERRWDDSDDVGETGQPTPDPSTFSAQADDLPLSELSTAEARWARIAIRDTLASDRDDKVWVLDEPEAALHRAAEQYMSRGLEGLAGLGRQIIVATHSPEVMDLPAATLLHVERSSDSRKSTVSQWDRASLNDSVERLGLRKSDLLGMIRVFLLVEGLHDEIVVKTFLARELEAYRVRVLPLRGGSKLGGTINSELLFDMTNARVVALLDNVDFGRFNEIWGTAQALATQGEDPSAAIDYLKQTLRETFKDDEAAWLGGWLSRGLTAGVASRLAPFGLVQRDIIEYLPVELLVPRAKKTWAELRTAHAEAVAAGSKTRDFKAWLTATHKATFTPAALQEAADAVTAVPDEFRQLGYRLREASASLG